MYPVCESLKNNFHFINFLLDHFSLFYISTFQPSCTHVWGSSSLIQSFNTIRWFFNGTINDNFLDSVMGDAHSFIMANVYHLLTDYDCVSPQYQLVFDHVLEINFFALALISNHNCNVLLWRQIYHQWTLFLSST